jgi:hypothetical protein
MRDRKDYQGYVRELADLLRLKDWSFILKEENPTDPEAWASIVCVQGRKLGVLRLSEDVIRQDPEELRRSVVHELLHCHLAAADYVADLLPQGERAAYRNQREYGTDALSDAIAPLLPLPQFADPLSRRNGGNGQALHGGLGPAVLEPIGHERD